MRRIDIFVSSPPDVQKERSVVERLIRSIAAEFNVPVTVSYSNRLRSLTLSDKVAARSANGYDDGRSLLCPCFWEYKDFKLEPDYQERIPNTGQYDLVISILWSRLGTKISPAFVMPDGSQPTSATEYEIAWVLDQMKRTPGFPELHVYRNHSTPVAPLEPREERETSFRQWDSVQEFFSTWRANSAFSKACSEYSDLREFESLFRKHFREFVAKQLDREIVPRKPAPNTQHWQLNPYRGLQFFDFEHAAVFYGRTKAIGEVLEVLKKQANAKSPFVLIIGPSGSGKSSLVRTGLLPFLTEVGSTTGPWRRAIARPGPGGEAEDPFSRLATALLEETALPELGADAAATYARQNLAADLRENPGGVARRVTELLDQLGKQEFDRLAEVQNEYELPDRIESTELARHRRLTRIRPKAHLALVVDSLEELFAANFSAELQHCYLATLMALIRSQRVFAIATLQSEFYAAYQQFPELIELAGSHGRYDLQPPTPEEIGDMIRLPAEAAGLRFEQDIATGRGLDKTILDAAVSSSEPLPLLEHLLSELYRKQETRKDGLLRQSDYLELGKLEGALGNHAETLFATLKSDAQGAFDLVMRRLVSFGNGDQGVRRTVPYRDLVSPGELDSRQKEGAKDFVDSFIKEGLFYVEPDSKTDGIVSISHQALLLRWQRVRLWLAEDQAFLRMRDRLDASLNLWIRRDRQCEDLLGPAFGVSDAETLLRHFRSSLSQAQIDYIEKILTTQKHDRKVRESIWLAMGAGLVVLAGVAAIQWYNLESQSKGTEELARIERRIVEMSRERRNGQESEPKQLTENSRESANPDLTSSDARAMQAQLKQALDKAQAAQQSADVATSQRTALETQLKQAQDKAQAAQQSADVATSQRTALETQLKQAQDKAQTAQQSADLATTQRTALDTQLKQAQDKAQTAQQNADLATSQRIALEAQLKQAQDKAQAAQKNADLVTSQRTALETQLKQAQDKAQATQQNADLAASQRTTALETQLKQAQDKAQAAQQSADLATSQRAALETQLKQAQDKAQAAQQSADLAASQRAALETQLKQAQDKAQAAQQNADRATTQRTALEAQLKQAQDKAQAAQQNADRVTSEHSAIEAEVKQLEDRAQLAEQKAELATSQREAMEAQMKMAEARAKLAQQNADLATSQRSAMEEELKKSEERVQLAQKNADLAVAQRAAIEARLNKAAGPQIVQQQNGQTNQPEPKANSTPTDIPISADPDETKQARKEQNQPGATQSNLVIATSPEPSPSETPTDGNVKSDTDEQQLKSFVLDYLRTVASDDVSTQERFFAHRVTYYGQGVLSLRRVQAAKESYDSEWPTRDWKPQGEPEIHGTSNPKMYEILQPYAWTVSDGSRHDQGSGNLFLRVWKNTKGEFHIVHIEQRDR
jgi:hypothetical protein